MENSDSDYLKNLTEQKIDNWKASLLDLGRRNPLIKFRPDKSLEILAKPDVVFKHLTEDKQTLYFSEYPQTDIKFEGIVKSQQSKNDDKDNGKDESVRSSLRLITRQEGNDQVKILKKLSSQARSSLEEMGVNSLFLAFGTLTWYDLDKPNEALTSPLILVPVKLTKEPKRNLYNICAFEEDVVLNPTLSLKLNQMCGIELEIKLPEGEEIQEIAYGELISQITQLLSQKLSTELPAQEKWEIKENIFLSLFSYAKAAMVKDLDENKEMIKNHPILQAICGDLRNYQKNYQDQLRESDLDAQSSPETIFQILDADSSQQVVIEAAKRGNSFVVQGPPGTGKSQTIVNMIAELIGTGKSVLLVAEKKTAIQVVYDRMEDLNYMCLDLHHGGTTDKRKLVENLSTTIQDVCGIYDMSEHDSFFAELISNRNSVNSYIQSLHNKEKPLYKSPFELFGGLLKKSREKVPEINVIFPNFNKWSPNQFQLAKKLLDELAKLLPFFNEQKTIIWAKTSLNSYSFQDELELRANIEDFQEAIALNQEINQEMESIFHVDSQCNLELIGTYCRVLSHILKAPMYLPENWDTIDVSNAKDAIKKLKDDVQVLENFESQLKQRYSPDLFSPDLDLPQLSQRYQNYSGFWLMRIFNRNYWRDRQHLQKLIIKHPVSHLQLKRDLSHAVQVSNIRIKLSQSDYPARVAFGSLFDPEIARQSDVQTIEEALSWLIGLRQYSFLDDCLQNIQNILASGKRKVQELLKKLESNFVEIEKGIHFLSSHFQENDITDNELAFKKIPLTKLKEFLDLAHSDLSDLQTWLTYKATCQELEDLGCKKFLDALRRNKIDSNYWFTALEKLIYQTCLDSILAQKPELKNFKIDVHERQIQDFAELDYSQLDIAKRRLKQIHAQRWQRFQETTDGSSELRTLKKEETKKRKHLPIRKLLNDKEKGIKQLVSTLKPCWMMSPLSVSKYIDPSAIHFDVLIFDEASQLRTEDVVSSIIRCDQVIVIGDRKQLPPTSFFSRVENEEDIDDEDDANYESVLDECSNFMFGYTLKWHYRSRDERLIAFSNRHFYDSKLVTFPNPIQNQESGVWFEYVPNGVYDRGGRRDNQIEAKTVADLTLAHVKKNLEQNSHQSLGIIAFSEAQANAIQDQIDILVRKNPELEAFCRDDSDRFFLKALENVQGDERDVILLSVGYGRDREGKLTLNFGPLNKKGGERRLNVAITRAKVKIVLISSIGAGDIDIAGTESEGIRLLRDYLQYVATGGERLQGNSYTNTLKFDSPFEEDVYETISRHSSLQEYIIRTQVGCSGYRIDLAIAHKDSPGEFLLGIECDGASYHSSYTARDRDRIRQKVLEGLGWTIHRIWSTEWFRNKGQQVDLLIQKINKLR
ncbi:DUF4011 domain-containing protein [Raphidiopsis sp. BLCC-F218]